MRSILATVTALICCTVIAAPAAATTVLPMETKCPIGGESFTAQSIGSYTSFGSRPDGRLYGTLPFVPLVECPGNGFVIFDDDLTSQEIAALTPLVASPEYQQIRRAETPSYRAWWLMAKIDRPAIDSAMRLLVASWESDGDPERKARYQAQFAAAALALPPATDAKQKARGAMARLRAANALRELGRFEDAQAALGAIDAAEHLPQNADERKGAQRFIADLRALIDERNAVSEPANMIPPQFAAERCKQADITASERAACSAFSRKGRR